MNTVFLYPSDLLSSKCVDEIYRDEYLSVQKAGLSVHIFDINAICSSPIYPKIQENFKIVYRGWMLDKVSYQQLERRFGSQLVTSTEAYLNAHYFPNWYSEIEVLTMYSVVTDEENVIKIFKENFKRAFCKDFVKSLKTGKGSIIEDIADISTILQSMKHYRGCIEGGIVLREVVNFIPDSEIRFFVINDTIFGPVEDAAKYKLVGQAVQKLATKKLKFYSVDVACTTEGKNIIVEIGDGQVSDYVGWSLESFMSVFSAISSKS